MRQAWMMNVLPDNSRSESRDNLELTDEINARGGRVAEFN